MCAGEQGSPSMHRGHSWFRAAPSLPPSLGDAHLAAVVMATYGEDAESWGRPREPADLAALQWPTTHWHHTGTTWEVRARSHTHTHTQKGTLTDNKPSSTRLISVMSKVIMDYSAFLWTLTRSAFTHSMSSVSLTWVFGKPKEEVGVWVRGPRKEGRG